MPVHFIRIQNAGIFCQTYTCVWFDLPGGIPPHTHTRTCTHIHTYKQISEGNTIFRGIMLWMKAFAWLGCCHDLDTVDGDTFAIEQQYVM